MTSAYGFVLCAAVLGSFVNGAWSLECYQCNSHNDSRCLTTPLPEALKGPCIPGKDKMCRKITQVVEFSTNNMPPDMRIIRSCGWDDSSYLNRCYQRSGFGGRQEVCSCVGEMCNSSTVPVVMTTLLLGAFIFLRFW